MMEDSVDRGPCCYDCGEPYDSARFPDLVVPHDVWNNVLSPTGDGGGLLCPNCMCARAEVAGLKGVPARFRSGPFAVDEGQGAGLTAEDLGVIKEALGHYAGYAHSRASPIEGYQGWFALFLRCCALLDRLAARPAPRGPAVDANIVADALWLHWMGGNEDIAAHQIVQAPLAERMRFFGMLARWQHCPKPDDHMPASDPAPALSAEHAEAVPDGDWWVELRRRVRVFAETYRHSHSCVSSEQRAAHMAENIAETDLEVWVAAAIERRMVSEEAANTADPAPALSAEHAEAVRRAASHVGRTLADAAARVRARELCYEVADAIERGLVAPERAERIEPIDGDGLYAALWWALDLIDRYDERLAKIDGAERVYSPTHVAGKAKARRALEAARTGPERAERIDIRRWAATRIAVAKGQGELARDRENADHIVAFWDGFADCARSLLAYLTDDAEDANG